MARYEAKLDIGGEFEASFSLPLFTGDSGNSVALEFYNRGKAYDMSGAMIYARRGDGTVLATSGVTQGNKAEFTLYNNMYSYPGELQVQVSVVDVYGNFLTSGVLYFTVQEGFSEQSEGEGSNDFCNLTSLIRQVGEGLSQIERAESASNKIESFLQSIENSKIEQLSESEVDTFLEGYAIVTSDISSDSNLVTGKQKWLLFASFTSELVNRYEVSQLRYYENKWQKRSGLCFEGLTGDWNCSWDDWSDVIPDNLITYKGSKPYYSNLPTIDNSVGDVWNVLYPSEVSIKAMPITVTDVSYEEQKDVFEAMGSTKNYKDFEVVALEHEGFIYNSNGQKVANGFFVYYDGGFCILYLSNIIERGDYYFYFIDESLSQYHTDFLKLYETGEDCKFIWNGNEWETFTGNMSKYATKDEIGDIETALTEIEALQNSYIGGDSA